MSFVAQIHMKDGVVPIFHKAYAVPYAIKEEVQSELTKLEQSDILYKVSHSDWACPVL